jgi:hypothetical protein
MVLRDPRRRPATDAGQWNAPIAPGLFRNKRRVVPSMAAVTPNIRKLI